MEQGLLKFTNMVKLWISQGIEFALLFQSWHCSLSAQQPLWRDPSIALVGSENSAISRTGSVKYLTEDCPFLLRQFSNQ